MARRWVAAADCDVARMYAFFMAVFWIDVRNERVKDLGTMKPIEPTPQERMRRMREMFAENYSVLAEDYRHFTGINPQDAAIRPSKAPRKSAELSAPRALRRN